MLDFLPAGPIADAACAVLSFCAVAAVFLILSARDDAPEAKAAAELDRLSRSAWVEDVVANGRGLLAVQLLRGSAAIEIGIGLAALVVAALAVILGASGPWGAPEPSHDWLVRVRLGTLAAFLVAGFLYSAAFARQFERVGIMLSIGQRRPDDPTHKGGIVGRLDAALSLRAACTRIWIASIPVLFWQLGPWAMLAGAALACVLVLRVHKIQDGGL